MGRLGKDFNSKEFPLINSSPTKKETWVFWFRFIFSVRKTCFPSEWNEGVEVGGPLGPVPVQSSDIWFRDQVQFIQFLNFLYVPKEPEDSSWEDEPIFHKFKDSRHSFFFNYSWNLAPIPQ